MQRVRRIRRATSSHRQEFTAPEMAPEQLPSQDPGNAALLRERMDLHAQLFEAAQIQRKLSGPRMMKVGDVQFASEVFAARYLSGDFVTLSADGPVVCAALGDIAGKGLAAGMWFTNLVGLLYRYANCADPAKVATEINQYLCCMSPGAPFVTMFLAHIDTATNELSYCTAGHYPPLVVRDSGEFERLEQGGPLLGVMNNATFARGRITLHAGDTVVAYSDGILECCDGLGEEFGVERLEAAARTALRGSAHATVMSLLGSVQDFANGNPICDDMSLMVIHREKKLALM